MFRAPAAAVAAALSLALPAASFLPAAPVAAQPATAELDRIVAALRAITTMKADFVQTDRRGQSLSGELTFKNPGRIRFEYGAGANLLIVSNGQALTMVDYDVRQVERWPISNSPLGALLDPDRDVRRYGTLRPTGTPGVLSVEVADPARPEYGRITLIFTRNGAAPGGLQLDSWVALDSQNHRTTVRLSNHRYGMAVGESAFTFRDPRGSSRRPR